MIVQPSYGNIAKGCVLAPIKCGESFYFISPDMLAAGFGVRHLNQAGDGFLDYTAYPVLELSDSTSGAGTVTYIPDIEDGTEIAKGPLNWALSLGISNQDLISLAQSGTAILADYCLCVNEGFVAVRDVQSAAEAISGLSFNASWCDAFQALSLAYLNALSDYTLSSADKADILSHSLKEVTTSDVSLAEGVWAPEGSLYKLCADAIAAHTSDLAPVLAAITDLSVGCRAPTGYVKVHVALQGACTSLSRQCTDLQNSLGSSLDAIANSLTTHEQSVVTRFDAATGRFDDVDQALTSIAEKQDSASAGVKTPIQQALPVVGAASSAIAAIASCVAASK